MILHVLREPFLIDTNGFSNPFIQFKPFVWPRWYPLNGYTPSLCFSGQLFQVVHYKAVINIIH